MLYIIVISRDHGDGEEKYFALTLNFYKAFLNQF